MNRKELKKYIAEVYNTEPEYLWIKHPNYELFRHSDNRKWFAVIIGLSKAKLIGNTVALAVQRVLLGQAGV